MHNHKLIESHFLQRLLYALGFALPFSVFALPVAGVGVEPANLIGLLLLMGATATVLWRGKIKRLDFIDKAVLLCFVVACLSFVVSQVLFGWRLQFTTGIKKLTQFSFALLIFFTIRRYCDTLAVFLRTVTWVWRGLMVLAVLGLWQFIAYNFLNVNFLADWSWAKDLNPSVGGWRPVGSLGPMKRVSSFTPEPLNYCLYMLMGLGAALLRIAPPSSFPVTPWQSFRPSRLAAMIFFLAFLLSFSLTGYISLGIMLIIYVVYFRGTSWRVVLGAFVLGLLVIWLLNSLTEGVMFRKLGTLNIFLSFDEKESALNSTALSLWVYFMIAYNSLKSNPLLGGGIGGHSSMFSLYAPAWVQNDPLFLDNPLMKEGAGSLTLMLLSEMGIVGFIVFLSAFVIIIGTAWRAISAARENPFARPILPICIGLLLGAIGEVMLFLIHMPLYYFVSLWFLLSLISVIPEIITQIPRASLKHKNNNQKKSPIDHCL